MAPLLVFGCKNALRFGNVSFSILNGILVFAKPPCSSVVGDMLDRDVLFYAILHTRDVLLTETSAFEDASLYVSRLHCALGDCALGHPIV